MNIIEPGKDLSPKPFEVRCRNSSDIYKDNLYKTTNEEFFEIFHYERDFSRLKKDDGDRRGCYALLGVMPEDMFSVNDRGEIFCFCEHCGLMLNVSGAKWQPNPLPTVQEFCDKHEIKWGIV